MSEQEQHDQSAEQADSTAQELNQALGAPEEEFIAPQETKRISRSTLVLFAIMIAGLVGYYFMYMRSGPKSASAANAKEVADADATIKQFLDSGTRNMEAMQQTLRNTEKVVEQFRSYPSANQVPLDDLKTNPFRFVSNRNVPLADEGGARNRDAAQRAVQGLLLQSIVHSDTRKACMINNTLYGEGQQIDGFIIDKINPGAVIVRTGPFRFELKMRQSTPRQ